MVGVHETAGVQLGLLPVAIAASSLFPLLKSFLQRGVNLGKGEGIPQRVHREDGAQRDRGSSPIHHCHTAISVSNSEDAFECALFLLIKLKIS